MRLSSLDPERIGSGLLPGRYGKEIPEMKIPYGRMLKAVGLAFALVAALHFALPPSAAASCTCNTISFLANGTGTGADCATATAVMKSNIQNTEINACAPYNFCHLQTIVITSACQLTNGQYATSGSQRYSCYVGTNCPNGF
jgi:hypothetical protein